MSELCVRYGKREHRGGLKESLETSCVISEKEFRHLVIDYDYYGFDSRCNQVLFINTNKEYDWLYIEILELNGLYYKTM